MESLSMKQLHIFGEINVFKTHAKNSPSSTLLLYFTLLLSLSFFLKFSSVQENPSNWKLVYTLQQ